LFIIHIAHYILLQKSLRAMKLRYDLDIDEVCIMIRKLQLNEYTYQLFIFTNRIYE